MLSRDQILGALQNFAAQRPGLDPRNYISDWRDTAGRAAYFAESRSITRDLHDARALLSYLRWHESIDAKALREAFRAFSGRLTLTDDGRLEYCTGQYYPTEYRKAVCAVAASALWSYFRDNAPAEANGDYIRRTARRELGRSLASRWFN